MGVALDEAGRDMATGGVDHPLIRTGRETGTDLGDAPALDAEIGRESRRAGAVDQQTAANEKIVHVPPYPLKPDLRARRGLRERQPERFIF